MARTPVASTKVERIERQRREHTRDLVAVEEPLQMLLEHGEAHARTEAPLAMTMRTPGNDSDLVTGFLYAEGVIAGIDDLISVRHCARSDTPENVVRAVLDERVVVPPRLLERNLTVTSACGVCGERTIESLSKVGCERVPVEEASFQPAAIRNALVSLEESQAWFRHTGGTHGAALFDNAGELLLHREDVGRHNALDKLIGAWLRDSRPASGPNFVAVSSRASFELVQKTVRAGFPMMVAIGAASSLAVETARRFDLTLVGFARESRFNVYSNGERIAHEVGEPAFVRMEAG
ncbi:MAG: formate dehydrogenase accessory sulfurtransferase FdhD [Deltaproteobacteria bacterium]|jgi:FdhD protein|nr:formate dehydrogenase accessory sulfurtransferase FdhD [Deltaproteobacteria bacterium]